MAADGNGVVCTPVMKRETDELVNKMAGLQTLKASMRRRKSSIARQVYHTTTKAIFKINFKKIRKFYWFLKEVRPPWLKAMI